MLIKKLISSYDNEEIRIGISLSNFKIIKLLS